MAELTRIPCLLLEIGFLNTEKRANLLIEMTPWPGKSVEETIEDGLDRLNRAWQQV